MDSFPKTPEAVGIGFIALVILWVIYQIAKLLIPLLTKSSGEREERLLKVIEHNATTNEQLSNNIKANTEMTKNAVESNKSTKQAVDNLTQILISTQRR